MWLGNLIEFVSVHVQSTGCLRLLFMLDTEPPVCADAWDQKTADFSGASASKGLHLRTVHHWASLELGSEAGEGATELWDEKVEKPKSFYADYSFIVLVRDNTKGALLLLMLWTRLGGACLA